MFCLKKASLGFYCTMQSRKYDPLRKQNCRKYGPLNLKIVGNMDPRVQKSKNIVGNMDP